MASFQFLFDLAGYQAREMPQQVAGAVWRQGIISSISSQQLHDLVRQLTSHFIRHGIQKQDRIILISEKFNPEWLAIDMAIMAAGAISAPLAPEIKADSLRRIIDSLEPALIIYSESISMAEFSSSHSTILLDDLLATARSVSNADVKIPETLRSSIRPDDIATIVHTSGSSGEPRAVCLSHQNIASNVLSVLSLVPFTPGTRVMSFLPLSHIFERIVCYVYLATGANIYFLESYRYALPALTDIKPSYFTSVPLVLERFAAIMENRIEEMSWFTRWAYRSWERTDRGMLAHLGSIIAHQWIIKRWKRKMGGRLKGIISGAAFLDPRVERLYERSGIKIRQGYGLTETSPVVAINRFEPGGHRRGTVGLPLPGVDVRIADDGEVLVRGPNVMAGYYKNEEATAAVIRDGWLHTGDIGRWEDEKFLVITDRKSNIYKHASGKFIVPAHIESALTQNPLIHQAVIIGFQRPFIAALLVPRFDELEKVCKAKGIHWTAPEYMVHNTLVIQLYRETLDHLGLERHEKIEKFILLPEPWSPKNGLLTATYKPRRGEIERKFRRDIEQMYGM